MQGRVGFGVSGTSQYFHRPGLLASEYTASHRTRILLNSCEEVLGCRRIRPAALPRSIRPIGIDRNLRNPRCYGAFWGAQCAAAVMQNFWSVHHIF